MSRLLLDANMPRGLRAILSHHEVWTAHQMGWDRLENGELLLAAEAAGFDAMITADQNIRYQQNLSERLLALVVLATNHWPTLQKTKTPLSMPWRGLVPVTILKSRWRAPDREDPTPSPAAVDRAPGSADPPPG
jgi:hypothetical protein